MRKVGITGGAGFIGSNLAQRLTILGHEVVIVDDLSTGLRSNLSFSDLEFHNISINQADNLQSCLKDCAVIFHLAARGSVPRSIKNPIATNLVNTTGTLNVLEVARATGAHVVFSSSSSVYGRNMALPKNESMWTGPITPYAASKLSAEAFVQAYSASYGVPTTLFRFFNVFGPFQRPDHEYAAVIPKWIWKAILGQPLEVFGDGQHSRDFTYIDTVLDVLVSAMLEEVNYPGPINLAFGEKISLNEVIGILNERFSSLQVMYKEERFGDIRDSQNSPELIRQLFPRIIPKPFQIAMNETIDWLMETGTSVANGPSVAD